MKRDLFRRYVWLIDTIRRGDKPIFEEIAQTWLHSPLNDDGSPLALRTFHNHRDAIEHLFGIRIVCDRSNRNGYYIADDGAENSTRLKFWMLQTLSLSNTIHRSSAVENRIILDITPEEKYGLLTTVDAMHREKCVVFTHTFPIYGNKTEFTIEPYCVRFLKSNWYMLGRDKHDGELKTFCFSNIKKAKVGDIRFRYPIDFNAREYFSNYFGMEIDNTRESQAIRLKVSGKYRDMLRVQPMHHTQREVLSNDDYSVFLLNIVPTGDFISTVLSMGRNCEVIGPLSLREQIKDLFKSIVYDYEKPITVTAKS
ncbi:MAG: WYL domain-containing protein [Muribaculaceae bacterium]|nr:WYL domain-containing protein [Muribaculaceae bacterium]